MPAVAKGAFEPFLTPAVWAKIQPDNMGQTVAARWRESRREEKGERRAKEKREERGGKRIGWHAMERSEGRDCSGRVETQRSFGFGRRCRVGGTPWSAAKGVTAWGALNRKGRFR